MLAHLKSDETFDAKWGQYASEERYEKNWQILGNGRKVMKIKKESYVKTEAKLKKVMKRNKESF